MHGGSYTGDGYIDFSVNLNPYESKEVSYVIEKSLKEGMEYAGIYPDISQTKVRESVARMESVDSRCVIAGNGSSELIMAAVRTVMPKCALLIEPSFSGYAHALGSLPGCRIIHYVLSAEEDFALPDEILDRITDDIDIMFLCDPWNPIGSNIKDSTLEKILDRACLRNIYVVLDRSFIMISDLYSKCTDENIANLIEKYHNLIIIKSFTKCFALPGIRMGYALACPEMIKALKNQLPEWNLSSITSTCMRSLSDMPGITEFFTGSAEYIANEREYLTEKLSGFGIKVFKSDANFILIRHEKNTYEKMLKQKIIVRNCCDFYGLDDRYLRIAVRRHEDNVKLINAMERI